jgi:FtsH-binding integral membrane protein
MTLLNIQYLTGGKWGVYLRKFFEASTRTLPLMALLFLPVLIAPFLRQEAPYWWAPGTESELYRALPEGSNDQKGMLFRFEKFLNPVAFAVCNIIWFAIWLGIIHVMNKWSQEAERDRDPVKRSWLRKLAGPAIITYALTLTFACTHWVVSLEPTWASTMFPVIFAVNQLLASLALCLAVLLWLSPYPPLSHYVRPNEQIHMGSLTLALTLFWTYISFAQLLLVWVANLPEEQGFYLKRSREGWQVVAWALAIFHFFAPFVLLLNRRVKENPVALRRVCLMLVAICAVDVFWWIAPSASHEGRYFWWLMDLGALAGVGGLWAWMFLGQLRSGPLLPVHETYLVEGHNHD